MNDFCYGGEGEAAVEQRDKRQWNADGGVISVFSYLCKNLQDFFVKAVWEIEEKQGYDLETVLNSTFCYKLHSMNTRQ